MIIDTKITIGEIVAEDFRTAAVFSKYGIDFCCKGHRTLDEVCDRKGITIEDIATQLTAATHATSRETIDFRSWPEDLLIDYIEKKHHRYVEEKTPVLIQYLKKIDAVHGGRHPELHEVYDLFVASSSDLAVHMKKEEFILFPFIKKMMKARQANGPLDVPNFGTVLNPVAMMKEEHDTEGERFARIALLTNQYTPPADACSTYRVAFAMLQEFEQDLHTHIHLENNILFPKAIAMESEFKG